MENAPKKKTWKTLLRLGLSVGLLAFAYRSVDLASLLESLSGVSVGGALALLILYAFGQLISAFKWRVFLSSIGLHRKVNDTIRAYFFGMYVNTFGLGTVGGDVARAVALVPEKGKRAATIATVVADRAHGLAILLVIGAIAVLLVQPEVFGPWSSPLAALAVLGIASCWLCGPWLLKKIFPEGHKYGESAKVIGLAFPREATPFLLASVISLCFHCVQIFMNYIIALELGADISLAYLFAVVPLVNIASSLPISVNGIGVREATYSLVLLPVGVSTEIAVAFGAIWIVVVTLVSAVGGVILTPRLEPIEQGAKV